LSSLICVIAADRSVFEHFYHIQVSPTCALQLTDISHTYPYLPIYDFFCF